MIETPALKKAKAKYYKAHKNKILDRTRAYRASYYQLHKERLDEYTKNWRKQNPEKAKEQSRRDYERRKTRLGSKGVSKKVLPAEPQTA